MSCMHGYELRSDLNDYRGKYVAICNRHIVAGGPSETRVVEDAKRLCPTEWLVIMKVP